MNRLTVLIPLLLVRAAIVRLLAVALGVLLLALAFAWPRPAGAEPLLQSAQVQCLRQATPPPPPPGGAVIAGRLDPNASQPNVVVIPAGAMWQTGDCGAGATAIMTNPISIAVAGPPQPTALKFEDDQHGLISPWGAVNVDASSQAPVLFPGHPEFTTTKVTVGLSEFWPNAFGSCRSCWLKDAAEMVAPSPTPRSNYAFWGDFSGATLSGATIIPIGGIHNTLSLSKFNLSNAKLDGVTGLSGADLTQANLSGADLSGTNLSSADLTGATLTGANLSNAKLDGTRGLRGAKLAQANLSGVNLSGVDMDCSRPAEENDTWTCMGGQTNLSGANLSGADLSGASMRIANLTHANLSGADLSQTDLTGTSLAFTNLSSATLAGTIGLAGSRMVAVNLTAAKLHGTDLHGADLESAILTAADLTGANLQQANLTSATLHQADLTQASLSGAALTHVDLSSANLTFTLPQGDNGRIDLAGSDLSGANLSGAIGLTHVDLSGANLTGANLSQADLTLANLVQANLSGAILTTTNLSGATLNSANLTSADLSGANLGSAVLQDAQLIQTRVSGTVFDSANLQGTQLVKLQFVAPPSFSAVPVGQSDSGGCTVFQDTDLSTTTFTINGLSGVCQSYTPLLPGSTLPVDAILALWQSADEDENNIDLGNAIFVVDASNRSSLAGQDLSVINLSGSVFVGWPVDLSGTNLNGANLENARLPGAVLSGASLQNVKAAGASFRGARLAGIGAGPGASFAGSSTDLTNADFEGADLSKASFVSANISGASFEDTLAVAPDFNSVLATNVKFIGAHIHDDSGSAFNNADDLSGADFSGAVLVGDRTLGGGFNLTSTNLQGAHFDYAQCIGCNFTGSNLDNATFAHAYVMGAVFSNATMQGADMTNAWLYCEDSGNSPCRTTQPPQPPKWSWPLVLGQDEPAGDIPFTPTDFIGVSEQLPKYCPDGATDLPPHPDQINGSVVSGVCNGQLQPNTAWSFPVCSAAGSDACPAPTALLFDASDMRGKLLSLVPMTPPVWSTNLPDSNGYAVGLDDFTVQVLGVGNARTLAGSSGNACKEPTQPCGDGGPASKALLGTPAGLAVGLDGSIYIADSTLHRVRRIDPSGTITTVAGSGQPCIKTNPGVSDCGNGGAATATAAQLMGPYGVWIDPLGVLVIADGSAGLRQVGTDGTLSLLAGTNAYDVRSVVGDATGSLYAAAHNPDYLIHIDPKGGVSVAVGTGTSGYNGNTDDFGLRDGNQVQISDPDGLSVDANGNILFADTGNNMVRAYVPQTGYVMDPLGGCTDSNGNPQGGNNGVGQWSDQIQLSGPLAVTSTAGPLLVVADTGNKRLLQLGPSPLPSASSADPTCAAASNTGSTP